MSDLNLEDCTTFNIFISYCEATILVDPVISVTVLCDSSKHKLLAPQASSLRQQVQQEMTLVIADNSLQLLLKW